MEEEAPSIDPRTVPEADTVSNGGLAPISSDDEAKNDETTDPEQYEKGMDAFKKDEIRRDAIHEEMNQLRAKLSQLTRSPANFRSMSDPSDPQDRGDNEHKRFLEDSIEYNKKYYSLLERHHEFLETKEDGLFRMHYHYLTTMQIAMELKEEENLRQNELIRYNELLVQNAAKLYEREMALVENVRKFDAYAEECEHDIQARKTMVWYEKELLRRKEVDLQRRIDELEGSCTVVRDVSEGSEDQVQDLPKRRSRRTKEPAEASPKRKQPAKKK